MNDHLHALPAGHRLGGYRIEGVLGSGGFGITYYARDIDIGKPVAIKEYLPNEFALRTDETTVKPKSTADQDSYQWGLERFLEEARALARFTHPHINEVYRFFEDNGTAYIVLGYIEGETLSQLLKRENQLEANRLRRLLEELLSGLEEVHGAGFVHRDIKPSNIMLRENGAAVLLDFGAARQAVGRRSKSITSILTPGYAPIEQYSSKGDDIGPWTDLYALGMVAYRCISGIADGELLDAVERARLERKGGQSKDLTPAVELGKGRYDIALLKAVEWAIRVDEEQRPQNVAAMREALEGGDEPGAVAATAAQSSEALDDVAQSLPKSAEDTAGSKKKPAPPKRQNMKQARRDGSTPLHAAALENARDTALLLISRGADVQAKSKDGYTPLHYAAGQNARDTALLLISHGADVQAKDEDDYTPLHHAVRNNARDTALLLISRGADVQAKSKDGYTPLHHAAGQNARDTAQLLISRGADVQAKAKDGYTPLHWAARKNARDTALLLISHGANVQAKDEDGYTPLHPAAWSNARDTALLLISRGSDVQARAKDGYTPLHWAARENTRDIVQLLISRGADMQAKDEDGWTPLHSAVWGNARDTAQLLISLGADVHTKDKAGRTPKNLAISQGHSEMAQLLR